MGQLINKSFNLASCPVYTIRLDDFSPKDIMESGQVFRFTEVEPNLYEVLTNDKRLFFRQLSENRFTFYCTRRQFHSFWEDYFDLKQNYRHYRSLIDPEDSFLLEASDYSKGLRILRQNPWEMLISFLLTQRKHITAIRNSIQKLCMAAGSVRTDCAGSYYAFPTPKQIASMSLKQLEDCSMGYRAKYVLDAARAVLSGEMDLNELNNLDNRSAAEKLKVLSGVGDKVAGCVMLFGYHRLDSFPVDVWIQMIEEEIYEGHFPVERYSGMSGVFQQYLFHYGRNHYYKNKKKASDET